MQSVTKSTASNPGGYYSHLTLQLQAGNGPRLSRSVTTTAITGGEVTLALGLST